MKVIVSVVGKDQVGIIAKVCAMLAENGANVLDISQTILQGYFTMIMVVDISACNVSFTELSERLKLNGQEIGMDIHMQREDIFEAMHRI